MAQSLARVLVHLIFSTKNREPLLGAEIHPELHKYMAAILKDLGSPAILVQSVSDHVHILFSLSKNQALMTIVEQVKKSSSKWIKTKGSRYRRFCWQNGYGAFSVSQSRVERVQRYFAQQDEHHRIKTFQEEFREFVKKYKVPYDERYVWD